MYEFGKKIYYGKVSSKLRWTEETENMLEEEKYTSLRNILIDFGNKEGVREEMCN